MTEQTTDADSKVVALASALLAAVDRDWPSSPSTRAVTLKAADELRAHLAALQGEESKAIAGAVAMA